MGNALWSASALEQGVASQWKLLPGPQTQARETEAFETLYGGAAGGGKTELQLYLARHDHHSSLILRREMPRLEDTHIKRSNELWDPNLYNTSKHRWDLPDGRRIRFGHVERESDVRSYQGGEYDLLCPDELTEFTLSMYLFLVSRVRTKRKGQRCRIVACTNPGGEGEAWVIERWAAWLDPKHPRPAKPGELRWYRRDDAGDEVETTPDHPDARSRTFVPARLADNPYLGEEYRKTLSMLPEPLRSQMLNGDWTAGQADAAYQIIPTAWVKAAMERERPKDLGPLDVLGIDVARGGKDETAVAPWYGRVLEPVKTYPGAVTDDGPKVANLVVPLLQVEGGVANFDAIGVGASAYDSTVAALGENGRDRCRAIVSRGGHADGSPYMDRAGVLRLVNTRAYCYWSMRDALDPEKGDNLVLPNDSELLSDLTAPRWEPRTNGIIVEDKEQVKKRICRSPNKGDAAVLRFAVRAVVSAGPMTALPRIAARRLVG